ncbi:bifunctional phosphopantothenoylcysteine decarboxylase/phosphopantothenate--cysteine ligase CoaBC [Agrococcus sp. ARC_14]|uniref:bifunctional phosphopantothenoylcysteine decarboxylase/phosphopantothenate--cysteine ligase CoaBC n=1 Tax=Agrococcus sp. ARC_14 TaxID=2919927 RepID=UPI001F05354E|nr:bifunctional phosphopantothenoylcysteine decarboxylase/phosphopantothenate--cysteine ligase CoaBC [Agrococcus sp. ARC_14]MCH1883096.1 bifunctional phosphopantothenoylcysteine decarboxylase/phosphopantothenate--cysteine ligase CoaBC [Agrococcus sp. ARC_14]
MRVVVGISGGIAAYKAALAIRELVQAGHDVHVVPTASALRFIGRPTLEALSRNPVTDEVFDDVASVRHVALGQQADLIVVLPATANTIAKLAHGLADDLLGTTILASRAPLVIAPAMHTEMWEQAAVRTNVATLVERGATIVGPVAGQLTGADSGMGRMAEPHDVVAAALAVVEGARTAGSLAGRTLVVSAGGTREPIDPVRFIGNRSSGAMGAAIAAAARDAGATVTLVGANLDVAVPTGVEHVQVETTAQLAEAMAAHAGADVVVMAAAVADYRVDEVADGKRSKESWGEHPTLTLTQNPDILAGLAKRPRSNLVVGFAAETETDDAALVERGRGKLARKGADLLVLNRVGHDEGFGDVGTLVRVLDASGIIAEQSGPKASVARGIIDTVAQQLAARTTTAASTEEPR